MAPKKKLQKANHHALTRWRFEYGLTLKDVAAMLEPKSTQAYLSQVEAREKTPSMAFAQRVCDLTARLTDSGLSLNDFGPK